MPTRRILETLINIGSQDRIDDAIETQLKNKSFRGTLVGTNLRWQEENRTSTEQEEKTESRR